MKKLLTLIPVIFMVGCTSNIIYVEKTVYILDGKNWVEIKGSELKDVTNTQNPSGQFEIPLP